MKLNNKGFSLIELMVVIAIIGILASIGIPAYKTYIVKARVSEVIGFAQSAAQLVTQSVVDQGLSALPADCTPLNTQEAAIFTISTANTVAPVVITKLCLVQATGTAAAGGVVITLTPVVTADGAVKWTCSSGLSVYAPANCQ